MKIILLSGGAGMRLWPLSTGSVSKQYIAMMKGADGRRLSMLQHTIARLEASALLPHTVVSTSQAQLSLIHSQLGQAVACIAEPERRDTFPAVSLACAYLRDCERAARDEIVVVLPVDAGTDDSFYTSVVRLAALLTEPGAPDIGLIGVRPTGPSAQYGYILTGGRHAEGALVRASGFREKPDEANAGKLIADGALWNCGVFGFKLGYLIDLLERRGYPAEYEALRREFAAIPARSFDYEVLEREPRIGCLSHGGPWKDLGTWHAVAENLPEPMNGRGLIDEASTGTTVLNELQVPVLVSGVKDAVVVAGHEGILVCAKSAVSGIKSLVARLDELPNIASGTSENSEVHARRTKPGQTDGDTSELNRGPAFDGTAAVVTRLHRLPPSGTLRAEAEGGRYVWTLAAGSGVYRSAEGERPAMLGVPYVGPAGAIFLADAAALLVETSSGIESSAIQATGTWTAAGAKEACLDAN